MENFKILKDHTFITITIYYYLLLLYLLHTSITCSKCKNEDGKIFKEEDSIEILKILCLLENI